MSETTPQIALVTGATRGIGAAIAAELAGRGLRVIGTATTDEGAGRITQALAAWGGKGVKLNVTDGAAVDALVDAIVKEHGGLHVLVNNAGITRDAVIWKMSSADFDRVIAVNLKGAWLLCREVAPVMRAQNDGRIINIASRGWLGNFGQSNYGPSKGGLVSLTRVLALELGRHNVLVNAVAPGAIDTPMLQAMEPAARERLREAQPTRCFGEPGDVAHAVSFLADPRTRFITGQTIYVDGGKSIGAGV